MPATPSVFSNSAAAISCWAPVPRRACWQQASNSPAAMPWFPLGPVRGRSSVLEIAPEAQTIRVGDQGPNQRQRSPSLVSAATTGSAQRRYHGPKRQRRWPRAQLELLGYRADIIIADQIARTRVTLEFHNTTLWN